ncbi:uncharacterized protein [Clytia hemisphaerica]|uniref:Uncharacterized protein n=1 Tax=Clytia hemisphaerica TaxID=252671 RepID=A0A7M5UYX7_9CNID
MRGIINLLFAVCFILVLQDGLYYLGSDENYGPPSTLLLQTVEAKPFKGLLKKLFEKLKKTRPPNNRKKTDQASDNLDRATEVGERIARERKEREEHARRRAHEKAKRDEERMNRMSSNRRSGSDRNRERNNGGRDRTREKVERDRERLDRG